MVSLAILEVAVQEQQEEALVETLKQEVDVGTDANIAGDLSIRNTVRTPENRARDVPARGES